tara:strand:- start:35 stop:358 length:324 start_codon:yes stop_codon:yes gene_type:complete
MTELPVKVRMPPMLYTDMKGQRWAVSGQYWVAVPETSTLDTIGDYMIHVPWTAAAKPTLVSQSWAVKGSKGNEYTVSVTDGQWSCTCAGFGFRRKCRHIQEIKDASG